MCRNIDNEHGDASDYKQQMLDINSRILRVTSTTRHQLLIKIQTIVSSVKDRAISEKRLSLDSSNYVNFHSLMSIHLFISKLQSSNKLYL